MKKSFLIATSLASDADAQLTAFLAGSSSAGVVTTIFGFSTYVKDGIIHYAIIYS